MGNFEDVCHNRKFDSSKDTNFLFIFQIFDEILVNAADNKQRDKKMDTIKIDIKPEENTIRVRLYIY